MFYYFPFKSNIASHTVCTFSTPHFAFFYLCFFLEEPSHFEAICVAIKCFPQWFVRGFYSGMLMMRNMMLIKYGLDPTHWILLEFVESTRTVSVFPPLRRAYTFAVCLKTLCRAERWIGVRSDVTVTIIDTKLLAPNCPRYWVDVNFVCFCSIFRGFKASFCKTS